MEVVM